MTVHTPTVRNHCVSPFASFDQYSCIFFWFQCLFFQLPHHHPDANQHSGVNFHLWCLASLLWYLLIFLSDYVWRRCPWLCQGTEEQISNQKVFCEASSNGLPASADCLRGGQHGNVSSGQSTVVSHLMYIGAPLSWLFSFTPKCKQSLLFLSLDSFNWQEKNRFLCNCHVPI